ncbi:MAG: serine/threonine protein kinase, partial [Planctomycetota bacterium]
GGGSGAKLYIAEPEEAKLRRQPDLPDRVVIKCFMLTEGSTLPQIVRESRALEAAKRIGLVLDHDMDEHRFYYVMPYHPGEHLGVITRQLHGQSSRGGLDAKSLKLVMSYIGDLLHTLSVYHGSGLWHKDVKPENVIVHDGSAHLVDLGLVTPLRSAMTLTTHGTEYFRDPEMVRQALRGVKVHQVDGAKFDIYAVGAVLYFMIENTFPAHGGLSAFSKKSPEALRWIVRRAMADYNKRYTSADEMLEDLRAVAVARDLMAVRPADLPSMGGEAPVAAAAGDVAAAAVSSVFSSVSTPTPTPTPEPAPAVEPAPAGAPHTSRPRLRLTNWWTGAYAVDDAGVGPGTPMPGDPDFRTHARELRQQAQDMRRRVHAGAISARRAAREQLKSARARARDLQRRARTRQHHRAVAERQPTPALIGAVFGFALITGLVGLVFLKVSQESRSVSIAVNGPQVETKTISEGPALMLVVDGDRSNPQIALGVKEIMKDYSERGYEVILPRNDESNNRFLSAVQTWYEAEGEEESRLERMLDNRELDGLVTIATSGDQPETLTLHDVLIRFGFEADDEPEPLPDPDPKRLPLLLVNDHPAKADPRVEERVEQIVRDYRLQRWDVRLDDAAEAAVRPVLPASPGNRAASPIPVRFHHLLRERDLGGVIWITAGSGAGEPHDRLVVERIDAEHAPGATMQTSNN